MGIAGGLRALITSADTSAGSLVAPQFFGNLDGGLYPSLLLAALDSRIPTTSELVTYSREVSHIAAAEPTADAEALTGSSGMYPRRVLA